MDLLGAAEDLWAEHLFSIWGSGAWAEQPAEDLDYGQHHLAEHLIASSGPVDRLYSLVSMAWMQSWYALESGYAGFLNDVDRAWSRADRPRAEGHLVMQCKCALSHSSVVTLASRVPPELFAPLIEHGIYSFELALSVADKTPAGYQRIAAWNALIPLMPREAEESVVREAMYVEPLTDRVKILCALIPRLSASAADGAWHAALDAAQREGDITFRRGGIVAVVRCATARTAKDALRVTSETREFDRADMIVDLVPVLPEALLDDAVEMALALRDPGDRIRALTALLERVPSDKERIVSAIRESLTGESDVESMARQLSTIARLLDRDEVRAKLAAALDEVSNLDSYASHHALRALAPLLDDGLLDRAFELAARIEDAIWRARAVAIVAVRDQARLGDRALQLFRELSDAWARAEGLTALLPAVTQAEAKDRFAEVVTALRQIESESDRRNTLKDALAATRVESAGDAVDVVRSFDDANYRSETCAMLVQRWPDDRVLAREALDCAKGLRPVATRLESIIALIPHLSSDVRDEAFRAATAALGRIRDTDDRSTALLKLIPFVPLERIPSMADLAERIADPLSRGRALCALADRVHGDAAVALYRRAQAAVAVIGDAADRAGAVTRLLAVAEPATDEGDSEPSGEVSEGEAREHYRFLMSDDSALDDAVGWIRRMQSLIPHLPPDMRGEAARNVYGFSIGATLDRYDYAYASESLVAIARYLDDRDANRLYEEALERATHVEDQRTRVESLAGLVPHVPEPYRGRAIEGALVAARSTPHEDHRAPVLAGLMPYLSGEPLREAVADALALPFISTRTSALEAVSARLVSMLEVAPDFVHECWTFAVHRIGAFPRAEAVDVLASFSTLVGALGQQGEDDVRRAVAATIDDIGEWWP